MKKLSKIVSAALAALMLSSTVAVMPASAATSKSAKPAPIKVANTDKGIKVSWEKTKGAKKYVVMRKLSSQKKYTVLKTVKGAKAGSFVDKSAKIGKKYTYAVSTNASVAKPKKTKEMVRLVAPTNVKAKLVQGSKDNYIQISWKKAKGATQYSVYRSEVLAKGKLSKPQLIDSSRKTGYKDEFYFSDTEVGKTYVYYVSSEKGDFESAKSKKSNSAVYVAKIKPVAMLSSDKKGVTLYIDDQNKATDYKIYRKAETESAFSLIDNVKSASLKKGFPLTIEFNEQFLSGLGGTVNQEFINEVSDKMQIPAYVDNNVIVGTKYSYYIEATVKGVKTKSLTTTIRYNEADFVLKTGDVKEISELVSENPMLSEVFKEQNDLMPIKFEYDIENQDIATVDKDGTITALAPGETKIAINMTVVYNFGMVSVPYLTATYDGNIKVTE